VTSFCIKKFAVSLDETNRGDAFYTKRIEGMGLNENNRVDPFYMKSVAVHRFI